MEGLGWSESGEEEKKEREEKVEETNWTLTRGRNSSTWTRTEEKESCEERVRSWSAMMSSLSGERAAVMRA